MGTTLTGTGETVTTATSDNLQKLKEKLEQEIKARKDLENCSSRLRLRLRPRACGSSCWRTKTGRSIRVEAPL